MAMSGIRICLPHNGRDPIEETSEAEEAPRALPKLTPKQERFVEAFTGPAKGNATEAARLAGYRGSDSTLRALACRTLQKPAVRTALDALTAQIREHAFLDAQERQLFLARMAAGEITDWTIVDGAPVEVPLRARDRLAASEQLNRMQGAYLERREVMHLGAVVIYEPRGEN